MRMVVDTQSGANPFNPPLLLNICRLIPEYDTPRQPVLHLVGGRGPGAHNSYI